MDIFWSSPPAADRAVGWRYNGKTTEEHAYCCYSYPLGMKLFALCTVVFGGVLIGLDLALFRGSKDIDQDEGGKLDTLTRRPLVTIFMLVIMATLLCSMLQAICCLHSGLMFFVYLSFFILSIVLPFGVVLPECSELSGVADNDIDKDICLNVGRLQVVLCVFLPFYCCLMMILHCSVSQGVDPCLTEVYEERELVDANGRVVPMDDTVILKP